MPQEAIAQRLLVRLRQEHEFELYRFSLLCSPDALSERLAGRGAPQQTEDAIARLSLIEQQNTNLTPVEVAKLIASKVSD